MDYIWSDCHFSHYNIIRYANRPFSTVEEMNKMMISNWQKIVTKHDKIFNLGDVYTHMSREAIKNLITTMPGYKILILGNHDRSSSVSKWRDIGFDEVYPYPIIYKDFFILSHEPIFLNDKMPYVNIHGHIHDKNYEQVCYVNVSVEQINYTPISIESIMNRYKDI